MIRKVMLYCSRILLGFPVVGLEILGYSGTLVKGLQLVEINGTFIFWNCNSVVGV